MTDAFESFFQVMPGLDESGRFIVNNGFAVFVAFVLLGFMGFALRSGVKSLTGTGIQISSAVTYFTGRLDTMSERSEQAYDRISENNSRVADRLVGVINVQTEALMEQAKLLSAMNESVRIQLNFTTQQMAQQAALAQHVQDASAAAGHPIPPAERAAVIKPIEQGDQYGSSD